jgi:hypothetical protein
MSWFVAACFPGLLMLSTYGLQRIESVMHDDRTAVADVVSRLEQTAREARVARDEAMPLLVPALSDFAARIEPGLRPLADEPGLPTRPNRLFQPT